MVEFCGLAGIVCFIWAVFQQRIDQPWTAWMLSVALHPGIWLSALFTGLQQHYRQNSKEVQ